MPLLTMLSRRSRLNALSTPIDRSSPSALWTLNSMKLFNRRPARKRFLRADVLSAGPLSVSLLGRLTNIRH